MPGFTNHNQKIFDAISEKLGWMKMQNQRRESRLIQVQQLYIYPIKSCAGVEVESFQIDANGPVGDRQFMLIDANGVFMTQRSTPQLALFKPTLSSDQMHVQMNGDGIQFRVNERSEKIFQSRVFADEVEVEELSADASSFFSDHLHVKVHLVALRFQNSRTRYKPSFGGFNVNFPDAYPFLLTNPGSFESLNLPQNINMGRFRSNIVITPSPAWIEESWQDFKIGEVEFHMQKLCPRCTVLDVDQQTAIKVKRTESLLARVAKARPGATFGVNLIHRNQGEIKRGDPLVALS